MIEERDGMNFSPWVGKKLHHSIKIGVSAIIIAGMLFSIPQPGLAGSESVGLKINRGNQAPVKQKENTSDAGAGIISFLTSVPGVKENNVPPSSEFSFFLIIRNLEESGKETGGKIVFLQRGQGRTGREGWRIDSKGDMGEIIACKNTLYRMFFSADDKKYYMRNIDPEEPFNEVLLAGLPLVAGKKWEFLESLSAPWTWLVNNETFKPAPAADITASTRETSSKIFIERVRQTPASGSEQLQNLLPVTGGTEKLEILFLPENHDRLLPDRVRYLDADAGVLSDIDISRDRNPDGHQIKAVVSGAPGQPGVKGELNAGFSKQGLIESIDLSFDIDNSTRLILTMSIKWIDKETKELFRFRPPSGSHQLDAIGFVEWLLFCMERVGIN